MSPRGSGSRSARMAHGHGAHYDRSIKSAWSRRRRGGASEWASLTRTGAVGELDEQADGRGAPGRLASERQRAGGPTGLQPCASAGARGRAKPAARSALLAPSRRSSAPPPGRS